MTGKVVAVEVAGAVPVDVDAEHVMLLAPTVNVLAPLVAVKAVLPVLCQVTAPAVEDIAPSTDANAVTDTAIRAILLMVFS